jgi:hypothetical protein
MDALDIRHSMLELCLRYGHDREGLQRAEREATEAGLGCVTDMAAKLQAAGDAQACLHAGTHGL